MLTYHTTCTPLEPHAMFTVGHPIAIMTGWTDCCRHPYALYVMVRHHSVWSDADPGCLEYAVTVEVHTDSALEIDWSHTFPHPSPPDGTVFLCPHNLQEESHRPIRLTSWPIAQTPRVPYSTQQLYWQMVRDLCPSYGCALHPCPVSTANTMPVSTMPEHEGSSGDKTPTLTSAMPAPLPPVPSHPSTPLPDRPDSNSLPAHASSTGWIASTSGIAKRRRARPARPYTGPTYVPPRGRLRQGQSAYYPDIGQAGHMAKWRAEAENASAT